MTAFDYGRSQATADRLIKRFGRAAVLRRVVSSGPAHNPTQTTTDYACTVVITEFSDREIDGSRVLATDKKVLMSPVGLEVEPILTDRLVEADGTVYSFVSPLRPVKPAGTVVVWELQARR